MARREDSPAGGVSATESRWALIARIVASSHLKKSPRLQELLQYLGRRTIDENASEIHEQEIGCGVLGRPSGYDTNQDTIIRVEVSQLRRKIEKYFAGEGAQEELILTIPKGNYAISFRERSRVPSTGELTSLAQRQKRTIVALAAVTVILAAVCAALLLRQHFTARWGGELEGSPTLQLLWGRLFTAGQQTDIVVADSCLSLLQDILLQTVHLPEYVDGGFRQRLEDVAAKPDLRRALGILMSQRYTSLADVNVVRRLTALRAGSDRGMVVHHARDYDARNLNRNHAILLGSSRSNAWVELFDKSLNFRFQYDVARQTTYIVNKSPRQGEQRLYTLTGSGAKTEDGYGVVAFLPNLGQTGHVLLIAGTDMEGTEAVGQFVRSERYMLRLRERLEADGARGIPHFEVLLRTKRPGAAGQDISVVAHRLIQP